MKVNIEVTGVAPLLMHNVRLANKQDPIVREIASITSDKKLKNTDQGIDRLAHLEFIGGLYIDDTLGPYIPAGNMHRSIQDAAKATRTGKDVERALIILDDSPLIYKGPRDAEGLWADGNYVDHRTVKVGQSRVTRTRPKFVNWAAEFEADLDTEVMNLSNFSDIVQFAGRTTGLGDYRPRFGRFEAIVSEA